jgi:hypothetical protein
MCGGLLLQKQNFEKRGSFVDRKEDYHGRDSLRKFGEKRLILCGEYSIIIVIDFWLLKGVQGNENKKNFTVGILNGMFVVVRL